MILESFFKQLTLIHLLLLLSGIQWLVFLWPDADGKIYRLPSGDTPKTNSELTASDPT